MTVCEDDEIDDTEQVSLNAEQAESGANCFINGPAIEVVINEGDCQDVEQVEEWAKQVVWPHMLKQCDKSAGPDNTTQFSESSGG